MLEFYAFAVIRLRMGTDGQGVTTLVTGHGCPLNCRWCINPSCKRADAAVERFTVESLIERVGVDSLYFQATGGGICFGGGEPLLQAAFIAEFRRRCPKEWRISIETSLNVPRADAELAARTADRLIIDIKDMNSEIYRRYTGADNRRVGENLQAVLRIAGAEKLRIRVPLIPQYNTKTDREKSLKRLREMGFTDLESFNYVVRPSMRP